MKDMLIVGTFNLTHNNATYTRKYCWYTFPAAIYLLKIICCLNNSRKFIRLRIEDVCLCPEGQIVNILRKVLLHKHKFLFQFNLHQKSYCQHSLSPLKHYIRIPHVLTNFAHYERRWKLFNNETNSMHTKVVSTYSINNCSSLHIPGVPCVNYAYYDLLKSCLDTQGY